MRLVLMVALLALAGCETTKGAIRDAEHLGRVIAREF